MSTTTLEQSLELFESRRCTLVRMVLYTFVGAHMLQKRAAGSPIGHSITNP